MKNNIKKFISLSIILLSTSQIINKINYSTPSYTRNNSILKAKNKNYGDKYLINNNRIPIRKNIKNQETLTQDKSNSDSSGSVAGIVVSSIVICSLIVGFLTSLLSINAIIKRFRSRPNKSLYSSWRISRRISDKFELPNNYNNRLINIELETLSRNSEESNIVQTEGSWIDNHSIHESNDENNEGNASNNEQYSISTTNIECVNPTFNHNTNASSLELNQDSSSFEENQNSSMIISSLYPRLDDIVLEEETNCETICLLIDGSIISRRIRVNEKLIDKITEDFENYELCLRRMLNINDIDFENSCALSELEGRLINLENEFKIKKWALEFKSHLLNGNKKIQDLFSRIFTLKIAYNARFLIVYSEVQKAFGFNEKFVEMNDMIRDPYNSMNHTNTLFQKIDELYLDIFHNYSTFYNFELKDEVLNAMLQRKWKKCDFLSQQELWEELYSAKEKFIEMKNRFVCDDCYLNTSLLNNYFRIMNDGSSDISLFSASENWTSQIEEIDPLFHFDNDGELVLFHNMQSIQKLYIQQMLALYDEAINEIFRYHESIQENFQQLHSLDLDSENSWPSVEEFTRIKEEAKICLVMINDIEKQVLALQGDEMEIYLFETQFSSKKELINFLQHHKTIIDNICMDELPSRNKIDILASEVSPLLVQIDYWKFINDNLSKDKEVLQNISKIFSSTYQEELRNSNWRYQYWKPFCWINIPVPLIKAELLTAEFEFFQSLLKS